MTAHAMKLKVSTSRKIAFLLEDDGWNGVCAGVFLEIAKRKMEATLQVHIENVLQKHSTGRCVLASPCGRNAPLDLPRLSDSSPPPT
jgi:hypothetical protein